MKSLYLFTRDLRVDDNTALIACCKESSTVYPIFIFNDDQVSSKNKFRSSNAIQFMIESLEDLKKSLSTLTFFHGNFKNIIEKLLKKEKIDCIFTTKDYTVFAGKREEILINLCKKYNKKLCIIEDYCLYYPETSGIKVYQKFTPYYNACLKSGTPAKVQKYNKYKSFSSLSGNYDLKKARSLYSCNERLNRRGGRALGVIRLNEIKDHKNYAKNHNCLDQKTTELSAYIKFGCVSIREVYWRVYDLFGKSHPIIRQLIWHDFYYQLGYAFPHILQGKALKEKYDKIKWNKNTKLFNAWKKGQTGYPIVDACMTQLNETGYMHNRGRLIVASFLVKILLIDWREGERYFAQMLEDYDPLVNNGNWQWVSGSGADSQPYFRVFNTWLQSKRFDPNGDYIKKWLPQLKDVSPKHLHEWDKYYSDYDQYLKPIVDYSVEKKKVLSAYKKIF
jgi:deoxyribodipyrimidine photo-lyase